MKVKPNLRHYKKFRYDFYTNPKLDEFFNENFKETYVEYLLKLNTIKTINDLIFYKTSSFAIVSLYTDRVKGILVNQPYVEKLLDNLIIDLYMILNVIDFENDPQNFEEMILQTLFLIEEKLGEENQYLFAFVVNKIGNVFYS